MNRRIAPPAVTATAGRYKFGPRERLYGAAILARICVPLTRPMLIGGIVRHIPSPSRLLVVATRHPHRYLRLRRNAQRWVDQQAGTNCRNGEDVRPGERRLAFVRQILELSTAHLPEHIRERLGEHGDVRAWETEYGWFMWAPDDPDDEFYRAVPVEVVGIWRFARAHGCDYVLLDRDSEAIGGLPSWD